MSGLGGPAARRWGLLAIAALWVATDVLLVRIAAGAGFSDWAHTYREMPKLFIAILVVAVVNLVVATLVVLRPTRSLLLVTVAWGALVAIFGLVLLVLGNDTSGSVISVVAVIAGWLAYRAAGEAAGGQ